MLDQIRVVLINTSHPGNIGAAARAMKTMGIGDLVLVDPQGYENGKPTADTWAVAEPRASGALDVLEGATVVNTLAEATADCGIVMGTSARSRHIPWPLMHPRTAAAKAVEAGLANNKVALVFGRERTGLTNDELAQCQVHIHVPTNPDYSSLNVAAAVQVLCYELRMTALAQSGELDQDYAGQWGVSWDQDLATQNDMNGFFQHLEQTLVEIEFLDPNNPKQLMPRLRRLFQRAAPDKTEVNILRGILKMVLRNR